MAKAIYRIGQYGANQRYRVDVEDSEGGVLLYSQFREMKPMCLNEIRWMRVSGLKDGNYLLCESKEGKPRFELVANDGHLLGTSPDFADEEARTRGIEALKAAVADAEIVDTTPKQDLSEHYHRVLHECALKAEAEKEEREAAEAASVR